ncbi:activator-dependent family glycosyltransferase [Streptomyces sp. SID8356]|uniref:activator-dependent family glycosyltransferase n=1 Tax=unclassified Streptomyces TaxID=2593676 RepID=UPI00035FE73C|nr:MULTISPECIES: activator-dependent family glycosyltransferase [unclassified Streptomyces]MYT37411.1 activator-dependent family glycosyltransferase [Streptomyces sp. SID8356]
MRVLMTSFAEQSHFSGSVPLAWALRTAGHEVRVASQPALAPAITGAGLTAVPVGENPALHTVLGAVGGPMMALHDRADYLEKRHERLGRDFLMSHETVMTSLFYSWINNESMVDELVAFARAWRPDLVIWEPFTFAGAVAARASGAAHARLLSFPDMFMSTRRLLREHWERGTETEHDDALGEWLALTLERYGCSFDEEIVTGQWSIDQMPPSVRLSLEQPLVPMRYVPYSGQVPTVVPPWLRSAPAWPRICVTAGMTTRYTGAPSTILVDDVFDAVSGLDAEVVATVDPAERELIPSVPDNVRLVDHVPLDVLLPTCAAILHHGGAGTWATAAASGVPQISLGRVWDAVYRSQRLAELGAGLYLPAGGVSAESLRSGLLRLLKEPEFRLRAQELQAEVNAAPSPNEVVEVLERLTARHRSRTAAPA